MSNRPQETLKPTDAEKLPTVNSLTDDDKESLQRKPIGYVNDIIMVRNKKTECIYFMRSIQIA